MKDKLISEFLTRLNEPDPPHLLLLKGVLLASQWLKELKSQDRAIVFAFIEYELSKAGISPLKELLIMVLQAVGGADSVELVNKVLAEGEVVHGRHIINAAEHAKNKLEII